MGSVELLLSASRQIREEVAAMEVDILVGQNMAGLMEKNKPLVEKATKELYQAAIMASGGVPIMYMQTILPKLFVAWCCICCIVLHDIAIVEAFCLLLQSAVLQAVACVVATCCRIFRLKL